MNNLHRRLPCVTDMETAAARRMPGFVHDYLIGGLGRESSARRNIASLDTIELMPRYLSEAPSPDMSGSSAAERSASFRPSCTRPSIPEARPQP